MAGTRATSKAIPMSEPDPTKSPGQSAPVIILVAPQMGENIGMVARAMANFGLSELRLVAPRDGWPNDKATAAASRATHVVEAVTVFDDLRSAVADLGFVFATTARERDGFKAVRGPVEAARMLRQRVATNRTGILFGREKFGLDNDEISLADEIVTFPVDPNYASLNIAQAVLLMAYEWRKAGLERETDTPFSGPDIVSAAPKEELHGLFGHLEAALETRGYFRPPSKKPKMVDKLRAVLTRPAFSSGEVKVLRGIVASLDYFSPKEPRGSGYPERKAKVDELAHSTRRPGDATDVEGNDG